MTTRTTSELIDKGKEEVRGNYDNKKKDNWQEAEGKREEETLIMGAKMHQATWRGHTAHGQLCQYHLHSRMGRS